MGDEFYISEDILEWMGLKKSEYLSILVEIMAAEDFQFHEFEQFNDLIPETLSSPDCTVDAKEDGYPTKFFNKMYTQEEIFYQVVKGVLIPDQNQDYVFVPILTFVTRSPKVIERFCPEATVKRQVLS